MAAAQLPPLRRCPHHGAAFRSWREGALGPCCREQRRTDVEAGERELERAVADRCEAVQARTDALLAKVSAAPLPGQPGFFAHHKASAFTRAYPEHERAAS